MSYENRVFHGLTVGADVPEWNTNNVNLAIGHRGEMGVHVSAALRELFASARVAAAAVLGESAVSPKVFHNARMGVQLLHQLCDAHEGRTSATTFKGFAPAASAITGRVDAVLGAGTTKQICGYHGPGFSLKHNAQIIEGLALAIIAKRTSAPPAKPAASAPAVASPAPAKLQCSHGAAKTCHDEGRGACPVDKEPCGLHRDAKGKPLPHQSAPKKPSAAATMTRAAFDRLSAADKSAFCLNGGRLTD